MGLFFFEGDNEDYIAESAEEVKRITNFAFSSVYSLMSRARKNKEYECIISGKKYTVTYLKI